MNMNYAPQPPLACFSVAPQALCAQLLGGYGWKITADFNPDALGNLAPDMRASVYPPAVHGPPSIRALVPLHGPGTEIYLRSGFDWQVILHRPAHGQALAVLEAWIMFATPIPWTPPPPYAAAVWERARECVAHILEMKRLQDRAQAMWPTVRPQAALGNVPARSPVASDAGSEGTAFGSSAPGSTVVESTDG